MIKLDGDVLYQWEIGRTVSGFEGDVAQFANSGDSVAMSVAIENPNEVRIPDRYLATGKPVVVCDVETGTKDEETGVGDEETVRSVRVFPVKARARPKNYTPTKAEEAYGAVKKLADAAEAAAQTSEEAKRDAEEASSRAGGYAEDASVSAKKAEEAVKNLAPLVIETSLDFGASPVPVTEIYQAAQSGREVILTLSDDEEVRAYLSAAYPDRAVFTANGYNPRTKSAAPVFYIVSDGGIGAIYATDEDAVLALIARGGIGNIDMGDKRWIRAGSVAAPEIQVDSDYKDGFFLRFGEYEGVNAVAKFSDTVDNMHPVILRNVAPGTKDLDAVNKAQLDAAVKDLGIPFNVSGTVAQVFPVSGSPVKVSVINPGDGYMKLYCVGKNLFDPVKDGNMEDGYIYWASGSTSNSSTSLRSAPIPVSHLIGKTLSIAGAFVGGSNPGWAFYKADNTYLSGGRTGSAVVPEGAAFFRFTVLKSNITSGGTVDKSLIQVEIGDFSTTVETYREIDLAPTSGNIALDRSFLNGVNTFYAYTGTVDGDVFTPTAPVEIRVVGYQHPAYEIEKQRTEIEFLKSAILSLGANV